MNFSPHERITINDEHDCRSSFIAARVQHELRRFFIAKMLIVYRSLWILEKLEDGSRWTFFFFSFPSKTSSSTVRKFANKEWHDINGKLA